jgi:hypothetical protein
MRISSSTTGLYPVLVSTARKPAVAPQNNDAVTKTTGANEQTTRQRTGETKREVLSARDVESLNAGGLAQQFNNALNRVSGEDFAGNSAQGSIQSASQRAVAAYTDVATQEHRQELVTLLGIDVFA